MTDTKKKWSVKKRWAILGGVPLAMVATTAAAAAVFAALAGVQGTGKTGDFTVAFEASAPTLDTSAMTIQPTGSASISGGKLVLPDVQMFPGESFTVTAQVKTGSNMFGYVSGVQLPGLPAGYKAELMSGCGQTVNYAKSVAIKVTAPATQTPGVSWALAADSGVRVTPLANSAAVAPAGTTCAPYVAP